MEDLSCPLCNGEEKSVDHLLPKLYGLETPLRDLQRLEHRTMAGLLHPQQGPKLSNPRGQKG